MNKVFITILTFLVVGISTRVSSQAPNYIWADGAGGSSYDQGWGVATDPSGNVFMTGWYQSPAITFGAITLTNAGQNSQDIFIVKYDANGNVLWAKTIGGAGDDIGIQVSTDPNGNVFMTGCFESSSITFGAVTLNNAGQGTKDLYIVKYDSNGNVLWAKSEGGFDEEIGQSVSTDLNGNVILMGVFDSPSISFGTINLNNLGNTNICIVKYDSNGNVLWAKRAGGTGNDIGYSVATDASGKFFVGGMFTSPTITFGTTILTNVGIGANDIFITKYDANGNPLWAKSAGNTGFDSGYSVSTDGNGNVFMSGDFSDLNITFGTITVTNATQGAREIFIVKYDTNGNVIWAQSAGGIENDAATSVCTDVGGNVFMTGWFTSPTITFGAVTLTLSGSTNFYLVKYDSAGNVLWAKESGNPGYNHGNIISTDASGNLFMSGRYINTTINLDTISLANEGLWDIFIAKLDTALTSGFAEQTANMNMVIAPNPFTLQTTIFFKTEQKNTNIKIIDVLGKVVKQLKFNGKNLILERGEMISGIYFVQIIDENGKVTCKRLIIE